MISKSKQRLVITLEKSTLRKLNERAKLERRSRSAVIEIALEKLFLSADAEDSAERSKQKPGKS